MCDGVLETELGTRFDLADPAEFADYVAAGGPQSCAVVIKNAVRIAAGEIMDKQGLGLG
jgi:hypothetical protein